MLIKMLLRGTKQARPCVSRGSNLNGFTMIELMVAVAILAMAILGILQAYSVGFMGMADARDRTVATNFAREAMENVKNMDFELIIITDEENPSVPEILNGKFNRLVTVAKQIIDEVEILELKKVTTEVNWLDRNGNLKKVVIETLIYNKDL
ncbi:MAG: prepilin-type N-terminal cleavage/methylation domain-containing protein [Candidatus Atribacteria bacterium]|nr:prepilin-type N-terminal cleavage/methylation domain-containing protein [Candidatus Atribacteria bacterium]